MEPTERLRRSPRRPGQRCRVRTLTGGAAVVAALGVVTLSAMPAGEGPDVEETRATIEQWVQTRRILSKEKHDWDLGRELLENRIELVQNEIDSLRERITEAQESIAEADEKRTELIEENERFERASATLAETLAQLEERTRGLIAGLPEPIRERVRPLSQRLPEDPDDSKQSLGQRFQNVVGILNETNKFHGEITVTSEVRELGEGKSAEVAALYLGVGQSWYASPDGASAGVGRPGPDGWTWTPSDGDAAAILAAIAILKNETPAEFVGLPTRIVEDEEATR